MNLLVVDDDSVIRMLLRTLLTAEGYKVVTAADGEEALERLAAHKIDLILCDIYMPGIDGIHLRKLVRAIPHIAQTPFLFISCHSDGYAVEVVRDPQLEGFHRKGQPLPALLSWIKLLTTPVSKRSKLHQNGFAKVSPHGHVRARQRSINTGMQMM